MSDNSGDYFYKPYVPSLSLSGITTTQETLNNNLNTSTTMSSHRSERKLLLPTNVTHVTLNLKIKYDYPEVKNFIDDLKRPDSKLRMRDRELSVLQLYTLNILNEPVDMSNQSERKIYRPKLFVRRNDECGSFNYNYLLNLFEIEYECPNGGQFPEVWKTTDGTNVTIKVFPYVSQHITTETNVIEDDTTTLIGVLRAICRENNYDETDANRWLDYLKMENINTIDHLRYVTKDAWDKLNRITHVVKQLIRDYMQTHAAIASFSQHVDPYQESKATLLGDIHRVRRYFYHTIRRLDLTSCLSREAVDLAIDEVGKTYDDDGNILINIKNYLRMFCLNEENKDQSRYSQYQKQWANKISELQRDQTTSTNETEGYKKRLEDYKRNLKVTELRTKNIIDEELIILNKVANLKGREAERIKQEYYANRQKAVNQLENDRQQHEPLNKLYADSVAKMKAIKKQIETLKKLGEFKLDEQQKKLIVKYGRGLLLYGPPGTGKSELLKRVAIYAGITMITQPLSAGELNRPHVGETEQLLVDIMSRAQTIPFSICAMTIDEIDGLVPKRDNNAQQGKVDGISVLLSHIEGVKNIANLVVFGATNRRNMMDEAFLRRMQAKVFVGRPSPEIRKKMLIPFVCEYSHIFTPERLDSLVKITTNFSGAAVSALRSNLIVEIDGNPNITDHRLLELADGVAREYNVWFGINTLPELCRLNPTILNSASYEQNYSLDFDHLKPTGRILIDYTDRKCSIEMQNEPTLERELNKTETSLSSLLARFIYGCSTRNIDTIQTIDLNFLIKQNAFHENQIFELLTTIFLECNEYNRSMLIFDIDSLIMLNKSDSEMSKSKSISNIQVYQFLREKCKTSIIEQTEPNKKGEVTKIEKWIVMLVKDPWLKHTLIDDIAFQKSSTQLTQEQQEDAKRLEDETSKKCPKCLRNFIPKEARDGNCHYHSGFIVDINRPDEHLTTEQAQIILQCSMLKKLSDDEMPKLIWACCLHRYGETFHSCETGKCGLPKELEGRVDMHDPNCIHKVQEFFKTNQAAKDNLKNFLQRYQSLTTNAMPLPTMTSRRS